MRFHLFEYSREETSFRFISFKLAKMEITKLE